MKSAMKPKQSVQGKPLEDKARELLARLGHPRANELTAGAVCELAEMFNEIARLRIEENLQQEKRSIFPTRCEDIQWEVIKE